MAHRNDNEKPTCTNESVNERSSDSSWNWSTIPPVQVSPLQVSPLVERSLSLVTAANLRSLRKGTGTTRNCTRKYSDVAASNRPDTSRKVSRTSHNKVHVIQQARPHPVLVQRYIPSREDLRELLTTDPGVPKNQVHAQSKRSTQAFKSAIEQLVPSYIFEKDNASCFLYATDYLIREQQQNMNNNMINIVDLKEAEQRNKRMMDDLEMAIQCRYYIMKEWYNGGDEQHNHFRNILIQCWEKLHDLMDLQQEIIRKAEGKPKETPYYYSEDGFPSFPLHCNYTCVMHGGERQEEETLDIRYFLDIFETDMETYQQQLQQHSERPRKLPCDMTLDELINGDDYFYDIMIAPHLGNYASDGDEITTYMFW